MKKFKIRWKLVVYDIAILLFIEYFLLVLYQNNPLPAADILAQIGLSVLCLSAARILGRVYQQIWRYGGIQCYIRLLFVDAVAFLANFFIQKLLPIQHIAFSHLLAISCMNLLGALAIRMMYRYAYKCREADTFRGKLLNLLLQIFAGPEIVDEVRDNTQKIKIAIVGAGRVGVSLAEELLANPSAAYIPRCYVDVNADKINRSIHGVPVLPENEKVFERLKDFEVQEVVLAIPGIEDSYRKELYQRYLDAGYRMKVYDYPIMQNAGAKRSLREFDVEELLFRKPIVMHDEKTNGYYQDKLILVTGGGGSIGSELCRQLAGMNPRQIVILDICENGAYDLQQELKIAYGSRLDVQVEIASVSDKRGMRRVFEAYRPEIIIHAAAHKHVPLMEKNCIEAVENNVFGTKLLVELCEEFGAQRFMMVSTDKAVNPTNVMGATKRMCEMIVLSASAHGTVKYSATRFGNVLGSAGSVIPLFKKQIAAGGPITLTDRRIIRYFMTIPEAVQLVLQSGAMAQNGELFVLDMGKPVKILDLAQSMIRLSGAANIEIREIGLRPGEKLYEELLTQTENLTKTENSLIFIERDTPVSSEEMDEKLAALQAACMTEEDDRVRAALQQAVPTYRPRQTEKSCASTAG